MSAAQTGGVPAGHRAERAGSDDLEAPLVALAVDSGVVAGDRWLTVPAARVRDALVAARGCGYDFYSFITCVDHVGRVDGPPPFTGPVSGAPPRFEMIYELREMEGGRLLRIRAFLSGERPIIASVHDLFGPANWDEREVFDLFGIDFEGHPNLTRILLPDDWKGHPLRRDYPMGGDPVEFSQEHDEWQTTPRRG